MDWTMNWAKHSWNWREHIARKVTWTMRSLAELYVSAGHPQKALEHGGCQEHNSRRPDGPHALPAYRNGCQGRILNRTNSRNIATGTWKKPFAAVTSPCNWTSWPPRPWPKRVQESTKGALTTEEEVLKLAIALDRPLDAGVSANNVAELHLRSGRSQKAVAAFAKGSSWWRTCLRCAFP
ncbi:MAG: hypothetical protein IPO05_18235 [Flavobacteriales bacterium]|nr:hypothetical protein [Flavobacteriales bacterium]